RLRLGVDGAEALELPRALCEVRNQPPAHQHQLALTCLFLRADHRLKRRRSYVEVRRQHEIVRQPAQAESLRNPLLVRPPVISPAHSQILVAFLGTRSIFARCTATVADTMALPANAAIPTTRAGK